MAVWMGDGFVNIIFAFFIYLKITIAENHRCYLEIYFHGVKQIIVVKTTAYTAKG